MTQPPGYSGYGDPYAEGQGGYSDPFGPPDYAEPGPAQSYDLYPPAPVTPAAPYVPPAAPPVTPPWVAFQQPPAYQAPPPVNRTGIVVALAFLSVILVVGLAVGGFFLLSDSDSPDQATQRQGGTTATPGTPRGGDPALATPTRSVEGFLSAFLVRRDVNATAKYVCERERDKDEIRDAIKNLNDLEDKNNAKIDVTWSNLREESKTDTAATVKGKVALKATVGESSSTETQDWTFELVQESGWRVCDFSHES